MNAWKFNRAKNKYEKYSTPDEWNCKILANNMTEKINCASCGNELEYGHSYCSLEIHNKLGFGYCVCKPCYMQEINRRRQYK